MVMVEMDQEDLVAMEMVAQVMEVMEMVVHRDLGQGNNIQIPGDNKTYAYFTT
jgi:hypothetical protein